MSIPIKYSYTLGSKNNVEEQTKKPLEPEKQEICCETVSIEMWASTPIKSHQHSSSNVT